MVFGSGPDLAITENCNQNKGSYSNIGNSYDVPVNLRDEPNTDFLAGSK